MTSYPNGEVGGWPRGYLYLPYECGICARPPEARRLCVAMIATPDSLGLLDITPAFSLLSSKIANQRSMYVGDWVIAGPHTPIDLFKEKVPETVLLHDECLRIYKSCAGASDAALSYLLSVTLSRYPWSRITPKKPPKRLPPQKFLGSKEALGYVFGKFGIHGFEALPAEIVHQVFEMSSQAYIWRFVDAVTMALGTKHSDGTAAVAVPVCDVAAWERGHSPLQRIEPGRQPPIVQISLDSYGISRIARLEELQQPSSYTTVKDLEFVVLHENEFANTSVVLKDGRARLEIPKGHTGFSTWDLPCPPPLPSKAISLHDAMDDFNIDGTPLTRMMVEYKDVTHFSTFPLAGITGLTFVLDGYFIRSLLVNTHKDPSPTTSFCGRTLKDYETEPKSRRLGVIRSYLPMPPGEKILAIGVCCNRKLPRMIRPGILIHTKLAGTVFMGIPLSPTTCVCLSTEPDILITTKSEAGSVNNLGAYSANPISDPSYIEEVSAMPRPLLFGRFWRKLTSFAPLDGTVRIDTVHDPSTSVCRGMLLYYENDAQRCVGEYRVGYHVTVSHTKLVFLCLESDVTRPGDLKVTPCGDAQHDRHVDERGRACYRMTGWVRAQIDHSSLAMDFADKDCQVVQPMQGQPPIPPTADQF